MPSVDDPIILLEWTGALRHQIDAGTPPELPRSAQVNSAQGDKFVWSTLTWGPLDAPIARAFGWQSARTWNGSNDASVNYVSILRLQSK